MTKLVTDDNFRMVIGGTYPHIYTNENKYVESSKQKDARKLRDKKRYESTRG